MAYYSDRPHAPAGAVVATVAMAVGAALVGGAVIGLVDYFDPFRILAFLAVVGGGSLIGWGIGAVARATKLHHPVLRSGIGLAAGFLACYALWSACTFADMSRADVSASKATILARAVQPTWILQAMSAFADPDLSMRWGIAGFPSGPARHVLYVLEIALLVYCVWAMAREGDVPFCAESGDWAEELEDVALLAPADDADAFRIALERGQFDELRRLRREGIDEANCYRVTLFADPERGEENYLSVRHVRESTGTEKDVVRLLRVPRSLVQSLMQPVGDQSSQRMPVPKTTGEKTTGEDDSPSKTPDDSAVHELV